MNEIITERLAKYKIRTKIQTPEDERNAIKEITQEMILYGLSKTDFFDQAYFCGGTALRIIHGLSRASEDLDFSTNKPNKHFQFDTYIAPVLEILKQFGIDMVVKRSKDDSFVKVRELKEDSAKWILTFPSNPQLKKIVIKLELDTNPPSGADTVFAYLDFPILHQVKVGTLETLFAGKLNALLTRPFVKGRDWYDLLWYIKSKTNINYPLLKNSLSQMTQYKKIKKDVNREFVIKELEKKIKSLDWTEVRKDVERFLKPEEQDSLKIWSENLFLDKIHKIV